jgi:predicted RNA-binding protein (virulence factor B family)
LNSKAVISAWEFLQCFKKGRGEIIDNKYIILLHELQQTTGLRAGNKLRQKHVNFKKQIMKVKLAAETLSRSVADALDFWILHINDVFC